MLQRKGILLHYNEQGLSENIPGQPLRSPLFYLPHPSNAPALFSFRAVSHKLSTLALPQA